MPVGSNEEASIVDPIRYSVRMKPSFLKVVGRTAETADVVTLEIVADLAKQKSGGLIKPGQFNMLYAFGVGEIPISVSGDTALGDRLIHTIRAVGPVSRALARLREGDSVGVRGPFGSAWPVVPVEELHGRDVLLIAGGIGLAPLRPVLYHLLRARQAYGRIVVLYGARSSQDLLFRDELEAWRREPSIQLRVSVDRADANWRGDVGFVTAQLTAVRFDPSEAVAMICGPEVMIRKTATGLQNMGVAMERLFVSMERNMKCAIGHCGHCQFGPAFVCRDGPVFRMDRVDKLMAIREI